MYRGKRYGGRYFKRQRYGSRTMAAPVSYGIQSSISDKAPYTIARTETIAVISNISTTTFSPVRIDCNPGLGTFKWLGPIARNFELYRFSKLRFTWVPSVPTNISGRVLMYFDYDSADTAPTSEMEMANSSNCARGPLWSRLDLYATGKQGAQKWYYVRNGPRPEGSDIKTYDYGYFAYAFAGHAANTISGTLTCDYVIQFLRPCLQPNAGLTPLSNVASALSYTAIGGLDLAGHKHSLFDLTGAAYGTVSCTSYGGVNVPLDTVTYPIYDSQGLLNGNWGAENWGTLNSAAALPLRGAGLWTISCSIPYYNPGLVPTYAYVAELLCFSTSTSGYVDPTADNPLAVWVGNTHYSVAYYGSLQQGWSTLTVTGNLLIRTNTPIALVPSVMCSSTIGGVYALVTNGTFAQALMQPDLKIFYQPYPSALYPGYTGNWSAVAPPPNRAILPLLRDVARPLITASDLGQDDPTVSDADSESTPPCVLVESDNEPEWDPISTPPPSPHGSADPTPLSSAVRILTPPRHRSRRANPSFTSTTVTKPPPRGTNINEELCSIGG